MTPTTFLLDLDNTLLGNSMDKFLPPYFVALETWLQPFADGKDIYPIAIASVEVMLANQDPAVTNLEAFMAEFSRRLGHSPEVLRPTLNAFYQEAYPQLKDYTSFRPEARQVVRRLFEQGYKVVIATNPLFPATAIEQRLAWAGLNEFSFNRVTTMENSHFSKPDLRYYREILDQVDSTPEASWMVGDDLAHDIIPANALGLKTWLITNGANSSETEPVPVWDKAGSLADFLAWIESQ